MINFGIDWPKAIASAAENELLSEPNVNDYIHLRYPGADTSSECLSVCVAFEVGKMVVSDYKTSYIDKAMDDRNQPECYFATYIHDMCSDQVLQSFYENKNILSSVADKYGISLEKALFLVYDEVVVRWLEIRQGVMEVLYAHSRKL